MRGGGDGRGGGLGADAPSGHGGDGTLGLGAPAQHEGHCTPGLGREVQPARGAEGHALRDFGHYAREARVAKPFFHKQQGVLPGFGIDHPAGVQADRGEGGGEQVPAAQNPEDRAGPARKEASGKEGRCGGKFDIGAGADEFMEGSHGQAIAGQRVIDGGDAERQSLGGGGGATLDPGNPGAQLVEHSRGNWGVRGGHVRNLFLSLGAVNANPHNECVKGLGVRRINLLLRYTLAPWVMG